MSNLLDSLPVLIVLIFCQHAAHASSEESPVESHYKYCPEGESLFSKQDLVNIINRHSDEELKILSHLTRVYNATAQRARDRVIKDFNNMMANFEAHPGPNFTNILDDVKMNRETKVYPTAKIAVTTLQAIPSLEESFNKLINQAEQLFHDVDISREICNHTKPPLLGRSSMDVQEEGEDEYMCSTIEYVRSTVDYELLSFGRAEIQHLLSTIYHNKDLLEQAIFYIKVQLRAAAIKKFGTTMYEILSLEDDQLSFLHTLVDFNGKSYKDVINKQLLNISSLIVDLSSASERYRKYCLNVTHDVNNLLRLRRSELGHLQVVSGNSNMNLLDRLIAEKTRSIKVYVEAAVEKIFEEAFNMTYDPVLIEKTIAKLEPLIKSIDDRTKVEAAALDKIKKLVPHDSLDHVEDVSLTAYHLIQKIIFVINDLPV